MIWWAGPGDSGKNWNPQEQHMFDRLTAGHPDAQNDPRAAALFDAGVLNFGRDAEKANASLIRYLRDEYDIDFTTAMPWEEWRAWYEGRV